MQTKMLTSLQELNDQLLERQFFCTDNLTKLIAKLKSEKGKNIYCDDGAEIVNKLLKNNLIDEFIISVIPVLLGSGTKLFKDDRPEQQLELVSVKSLDTGLTQLHYRQKPEPRHVIANFRTTP